MKTDQQVNGKMRTELLFLQSEASKGSGVLRDITLNDTRSIVDAERGSNILVGRRL